MGYQSVSCKYRLDSKAWARSVFQTSVTTTCAEQYQYQYAPVMLSDVWLGLLAQRNSSVSKKSYNANGRQMILTQKK